MRPSLFRAIVRDVNARYNERDIIKIFINVQSFIDDADSLRRKRQKLNNNSSSILFKHADTEKREYNCKIHHNSSLGLRWATLLILHCIINGIYPNLIWNVKIMLFIFTSRFSLKE